MQSSAVEVKGEIHILLGDIVTRVIKFDDSHAMMKTVENLIRSDASFVCFPGSLAIPKHKINSY